MNIFFTDTDPEKAARNLCNRHFKMVLESAQLLCTAQNLVGSFPAPYKPTHKNHPSAVWARASNDNYRWLLEHALAATEEFVRRGYVRHKASQVITSLPTRLSNDVPEALTVGLVAMKDEYKLHENADTWEKVVSNYRNYYAEAKLTFCTYRNTNAPEWLQASASSKGLRFVRYHLGKGRGFDHTPMRMRYLQQARGGL